jgi:uncharacterized membrane protein YqgA involved in biofilm formation
MIGTLVNFCTVIIGSLIGLKIKNKLPKRIIKTVMQAIGLFTIFIGIYMVIKTSNILIIIISIFIGSIIGELINIEKYINKFGEKLKNKISIKNEKFSEGFITAFLLYCIGSMTIIGAIEEGLLGRTSNILISKSILDGFSSIILASSMGIGVLFSAFPLLVFQGGLTIFAGSIKDIFNVIIINETTAVGGLILIGLGINILEIKKINVINMLPSLIIVIILSFLFL